MKYITLQLSRYRADIIVSIVSVCIGGWFFYDSTNIPKTVGQKTLIGPASLPQVISILFVLAGIILFFKAIKNKDKNVILFPKINKVLAFSIALFIYIFSLGNLNFYLASVIAFPLLLVISGIRNIKKTALVTVLFLGFSYLGFENLLGVPLP